MDFFSHRTAIEREVLSMINEAEFFGTELQGLSLIAIDTWAGKLHGHHPVVAIENISTSLKTIATGIHAAVNVSDEVFLEPDHALLEDEIARLSTLIYNLAK